MALLPTPGPDVTPGLGQKSGGGVLDTALNILDPGKVRLQVAGLFSGGVSSLFKKSAPPGINSSSGAGDPVNTSGKDWRVKISLAPRAGIFYQDASNWIQEPLAYTNGLMFPYTPTVTVAHNARYQEQALTHSNYKNYFYEGSDVSAITIAGDFTVQNAEEGRYLLAAIYFLRSCTKMFFGNDVIAGNPPPIVYLNGYGRLYLPGVSCVVTNFNHVMPADVDYLELPYVDKGLEGYGIPPDMVRLPTTSQLSVTLQPVYSRSNIHNNMTLNEFGKGYLISNRDGGPGFL
jgi:hypothetical protein